MHLCQNDKNILLFSTQNVNFVVMNRLVFKERYFPAVAFTIK